MAYPEDLSQVNTLIALLRRDTLRTRIGVWLMPPEYVGQEKETAARLGIEAVDLRGVIQQMLPAGTRFVHLTATKTLEALDTIASTKGKTSCVLVYNLDLLLAALSYQARQEVWRSFFDGFPHRARALVIAIPNAAISLPPEDKGLGALENNSRLVPKL